MANDEGSVRLVREGFFPLSVLGETDMLTSPVVIHCVSKMGSVHRDELIGFGIPLFRQPNRRERTHPFLQITKTSLMN